MKIIAPLAALLLFSATSATAADKASPKVVAFNASVRVEVDAAGKPTKVEAPADLPEVIRGFIEKRVASWQYEPAKQDGKPASAVTFVRVGACALPMPEGYRLGLDFKGNGPAIVTNGPWFMPPPTYPAELRRAGAEGAFRVSYSIQANGTTRVDSVEAMEGTSNRHAKSFRNALTDWIEGMRYQPEQVNGQPVATEMSFPVSFTLSGEPRRLKPSESPQKLMETSRQRLIAELQAKALASKECIAASMPGGPLPIATNSPVKVTPAPAG